MESRLPLPDACQAAGLPLSTGQAILRRNHKLALAWRRNRRGKPTPLVDPAQLLEFAYPVGTKVSSRFAHRCALAGANPAQVLWAIVNGSRMPDGSFDLDMISDAMRLALDDAAGGSLFLRGGLMASFFLAILGGAESKPKSRAFDIQLADLLLRQSSKRGGRMPTGDFAQVWKRLLAEVAKKPAWRRSNPAVIRCEHKASVRFASVPLYAVKLKGAAVFAGESRGGDRDAFAGESRNENAANRRLARTAAQEVAEKFFVPSGTANKAAGKSLGSAFRLIRSAHLRKGEYQPRQSEESAAAALDIMRDDIGISRDKAWPLLLAYWRRCSSDLLAPSASAVWSAFHLKSRARTGSGPRSKPKPQRSRLPLRRLAERICDILSDESLTKAQREKVVEIIFHLMQLRREGRDESLANLAQRMGFPSAGAAFFKAFDRSLIDKAGRYLDQCDALDARVKSGRNQVADD
jgi:hypothetical protein